MKWIRALDLDRWADKVGARTTLSELVSSLVRASALERRGFRFPTGDSAQIPDYDGRLSAVGAPPYVPDGESVWEFGVEDDYVRKADADFTARTGNPRGVVRQDTTFVFVTPRTWRHPRISVDQWQAERRTESDWKDVKVIDGVALEDWLGEHPAVAARLAREVVGTVPRHGARSLEEFWQEYAARLRPSLTEATILSDRADQAKELIERRLAGPSEGVVVRADSADEVVAFVAAAVRTADEDLRKCVFR